MTPDAPLIDAAFFDLVVAFGLLLMAAELLTRFFSKLPKPKLPRRKR